MDFGRTVARADWKGLPAVYEQYNDGNTITVQEDGKGGATITQLGKDGKPIGSKAYASLPDFMTDAYAAFDPEKWLGVKRQEKQDAEAATRDKRDYALREKATTASMANDAARTRMAASAEGRAAKAAADDAKIPPAVKMQAASAAKRLDNIGKAITDAMAQGAWDTKSAGAQQLLTEQRTIQAQLDNLLAPYVAAEQGGGKGGKPADPLGLLTAPAGGAAPAASAAGAPGAADVPTRPPAGPSMMSRAGTAVGNAFTTMRAGGAEYQAIDRRAREAASGGPPLTPEEVAIARRWGLPV
jgi:hypothetical protein